MHSCKWSHWTMDSPVSTFWYNDAHTVGAQFFRCGVTLSHDCNAAICDYGCPWRLCSIRDTHSMLTHVTYTVKTARSKCVTAALHLQLTYLCDNWCSQPPSPADNHRPPLSTLPEAFSFFFLSVRGRQQKLPSAEASKRAQCTSPGQYTCTPYIRGIAKTR